MLKSILTTKKARIPEMEFHSEKLKNPEFFCENRLPAHSDHEAFACLEDLEAGENRLRMSLNGYWKFFYAVNEKQLIPGFEQPEYDCADWADIAVPAHCADGGVRRSPVLQYSVPVGRLGKHRTGRDPRAF